MGSGQSPITLEEFLRPVPKPHCPTLSEVTEIGLRDTLEGLQGC